METFTPAGSAAQVTPVAYSQDAAGALTRKGDTFLHYGVDGRIAKAGANADASNALAVSYTTNALGQRVFKRDTRLSGSSNTPAITQQTVYAEDGIGSTVLGQYGNARSSDSAAPAGEMDSTEVIWLPTATGPLPVAAQINGRLYAIDADHLNTPRRLTNAQGQAVWQWLITGFGEANPTTGATGYAQSGEAGIRSYVEAVRFDLRYPGQVWDEETGLNYNLHRYYDAGSGRYIQADPIGLEGGWNRFGYAAGDPLSYSDPNGLQVIPLPLPPIPGIANPSADAQRTLADRLTRVFRDDDQKTYQTYTRYNPLTGQCYSGRTSGTDTPENNVRNRGYGQPLLTAEGFLPPVLDRSSSNRSAIRGREQQLIELNGGAQSSGGSSRNLINGISPWNPRGVFVYIPAANDEFGAPVPAVQCTCQ
ncbi:RHS repeat-associated core domain-containing protein [Acidovorax sp. NCPPB 4044]|uniref:RHS repeat-associated core domain-containing protein n=1 Tax=Acidovorax sp. NCPPB 4044 TaxID=2940490 RepID=UPI00230467A9|nr:RHS repeat-associated core domain-containing protein [Acidovorax sp. NCPPB 4044]MDA8523439.1 hypothetical protein [Acidovorax sp. NCPPB 4044]